MFFESIKILDGKVYNLKYHQQRVDRTLKHFKLPKLQLQNWIDPPQKGLYKLKLIYYDTILDMQYMPYKPKKIRSIGFVQSGVKYSYKYLQRAAIDSLHDGSVDAVIITQEGFVTDTTIANIAFYDGKRWITPAKPLLKGTARQRYIDNKMLTLADIRQSEVSQFEAIAFMNAMIGFYEVKDFIIKDIDVF